MISNQTTTLRFVKYKYAYFFRNYETVFCNLPIQVAYIKKLGIISFVQPTVGCIKRWEIPLCHINHDRDFKLVPRLSIKIVFIDHSRINILKF